MTAGTVRPRGRAPQWRRNLMKLRQYRSIYLLLLLVAAYCLVFSYYPMILGVVNSFREIKLLGNASFVGLKNYKLIFASPVYSQAFVNTVIVGAGSFALQFVWGLLLALAMNELRHRGVPCARGDVCHQHDRSQGHSL